MGRKKKELPQSTNRDVIFRPHCTLEKSIENNIDLAQKLIDHHDFEDSMGSNQLYVSMRVIQPLDYFLANKGTHRTAGDYTVAFDGFLQIIDKVNEKMTYTPTLNTFCRFIAMSTERFKKISNENSEEGDVCKQIKDFLAEGLMQNMLGNRVGAVQGIFIAKSTLGMRDNEAPSVNVVNIHNESKSLEEILEDFNKVGH